MLFDCIFSSNKRAKNWRDKQREYSERRMSSRHFHDKYNNEGKAKREKEKYYRQKDLLLSVFQPVSIHRVQRGYERRRIYDYEKAYRKFKRKGLFIWENCFYYQCRGPRPSLRLWTGYSALFIEQAHVISISDKSIIALRTWSEQPEIQEVLQECLDIASTRSEVC